MIEVEFKKIVEDHDWSSIPKVDDVDQIFKIFDHFGSESFKYIQRHFWLNLDVAKAACKINYPHEKFCSLNYLPEHIRNLREIAKIAVNTNGYSLKFLSSEFQDDYEIVLTAVMSNAFSLKFSSSRLQDDITIVKEAMKKAALSFQYASERLRQDEDLIEYATKNIDWMHLEFFEGPLSSDKNFVIRLSKVNWLPSLLCFVNKTLRDDYETVYEIVSNDGESIKCVGEKFHYDINLALLAIKNDYYVIRHLPSTVQENLLILDAAMESARQHHPDNSYASIGYIPEGIKNDREKLYILVKKYPVLLSYSTEEMKSDKEFILDNFVYSDVNILSGGLLVNISKKLFSDKDFVLSVFDKLRNDNYVNASFTKQLDSNLMDDVEVVNKMVSISGRALQHASLRLRSDVEVVLAAVRSERNAIKYASEEVRANIENILDNL